MITKRDFILLGRYFCEKYSGEKLLIVPNIVLYSVLLIDPNIVLYSVLLIDPNIVLYSVLLIDPNIVLYSGQLNIGDKTNGGKALSGTGKYWGMDILLTRTPLRAFFYRSKFSMKHLNNQFKCFFTLLLSLIAEAGSDYDPRYQNVLYYHGSIIDTSSL